MRWGGVTGCSGNNAAAPVGPTDPGTTEPTEPGPTDPTDPEPDGRTEVQKSFDAALARAEAELAAARADVERAAALTAAAATPEARSAASEALADAEKALDDAVKAARDLSAPEGDAYRRGQADDLASRAAAAQAAENRRIEEARASTRWSARKGFSRAAVPAVPEVHAVRRIRTNAAGDAHSPDLLDAGDFPAVPYEPGKILISQGEASSGDELRMQGYAASWQGFRS